MGERRGDLETAYEAEAGDVGWLQFRDVAAVEMYRAGGRLKKLGNEIEARRLARAIGTDQGVDRTAANPKIDVIDGSKAPELLGEAMRLDDEICGRTQERSAGRSCFSGTISQCRPDRHTIQGRTPRPLV